MAIYFVDFPIKNGDFPWQNVSSPEGILIDGASTRINQINPVIRWLVSAFLPMNHEKKKRLFPLRIFSTPSTFNPPSGRSNVPTISQHTTMFCCFNPQCSMWKILPKSEFSGLQKKPTKKCVYTLSLSPLYYNAIYIVGYNSGIHYNNSIISHYSLYLYIVPIMIPTMWGPPVINWFINPSNYSYKYHKP